MRDRKILCVPREYIEALNMPMRGLGRTTTGHVQNMLAEHGMFIDRDGVEEDTRYKQIIPYIMVRKPTMVPPLEGATTPQVLHYTRTERSGEQRLAKLKSVGFGGHIKQEDHETPLLALTAGMDREIREELDFPRTVKISHPEFAGLINDESNAVGQVHTGLLYIIDVTEKVKDARLEISSPDEDIMQLGWSEPVRLRLEEFETWSQITLSSLFKLDN